MSDLLVVILGKDPDPVHTTIDATRVEFCSVRRKTVSLCFHSGSLRVLEFDDSNSAYKIYKAICEKMGGKIAGE